MLHKSLGYTAAINEAIGEMLSMNDDAFVIGLGAPQGLSGLTTGLSEVFPGRVLDAPASEAALTGLAVGAASQGMRPIVMHDRAEFAMFAADQIFTQAAKWNFMHGGGNILPITFLVQIGRHWGYGPQHTQSFVSTFGAAIGLKTVIPSSPNMAYNLMRSAVLCNSPVAILHPGWLFATQGPIDRSDAYYELDRARVIRFGEDITLVTYGDGVLTAIEAADILIDDVSIEIIDLVSISEIDIESIISSVEKTQRLVLVENTPDKFSVSHEIIAKVSTRKINIKHAPILLSCPDAPVPTSTRLTEGYYPTAKILAQTLAKEFMIDLDVEDHTFAELHTRPSKYLQW